MRKLNLLWVFALLSACAIMPQNFDERVVVAYETNIAVRDTATAALNAGRISRDDARAVLSITDQARTLIESAEANRDEDALTMALEILVAMEDRFDE